MILHGGAAVVGVGLLAATAHVTIEHTGGYSTPHAILTLAIAFGVAVGALVIGNAWAHRRYGLAMLIGITLLAGEAFALLRTAERLVDAREQAQAPIRAKAVARERAIAQVTKTEKALAAIGDTSPRLAAAITANQAADRAVVEQASLKGCRQNCRALLQAQVDTTLKEIEAARNELNTRRDNARVELAKAQAVVRNMPKPRSSTPLADRLQIKPWILDLLMAALGGIGANGLGAALLAFGGHTRPHQAEVLRVSGSKSNEPTAAVEAKANEVETETKEPTQPADKHAIAKRHAERFCMDELRPATDGHASLLAVHSRYIDWCKRNELEPMPPKEIGLLLVELFASVGIEVDEIHGERAVVGVELKDPPRLVAAA